MDHDEPLSTIPTTDPFFVIRQELQDGSRQAVTTSFSAESSSKHMDATDAPPEEKKRRIDVDDPSVDQREVVAQLKSDLARVQNSIKMAANAHFKLSLREQEYMELKRQLDNFYMKTDDLPPPSNILVNDHVVVAALKRQAAEIQRLKEDLEREKEYNEARKFCTSNLASLKLVAHVHALLKENASLGTEILEAENPDKWAVIDLYETCIERLRTEIQETAAFIEKPKKEIQETEEASFLQTQSVKKKSEAARRSQINISAPTKVD